MDYLSHGIWSYIFFHKRKEVLWAVLFGVLPDSISFGPYSIYRFATGGFENGGPPDPAQIPEIVYFLYGLGHSLITVSAVFGIVYLFKKKIPVFMWAWPIAIAIDIPLHTADYLPTPFLWPLSDYAFDGISWGSWWFMVVNYSLIVLALLYIFWKKAKK